MLILITHILIYCIDFSQKGGLFLLYENCVNQLEKLNELLNFQERRNFFNKIQDIHLNTSIKIVESILAKTYEFEFSYEDLAEVITITANIISLLDVSEEVHEHLHLMNTSAMELKQSTIHLANN